MNSRTGAGDPARSVRLLWRDQQSQARRRGPRPALTIDDVVDAAIELADQEGIRAVTMRRLASMLDVAPMALYRYVPSKAELLDLMLDRVYLDMPREGGAEGRWRVRLKAVAEENRALYRAHPWAAEIATTRPPLGPGQLAKYEHELGALEVAGLDDVTADAALALVVGFVRANAREAAESDLARKESGISDTEWWERAAPVLAELVDPDAFPRASRVGTAAGEAHGTALDPDRAFDFGLERILDGIARLMESGESESGTRRADRSPG
jgi:AcrR family transcriptional regulator